MPSNYFEMMRDVVGSYGDGVDLARARRRQDEMDERQRAVFEQQQRDWAELNARRDELNQARSSYRALQGGIYAGGQTDWSTAPNPAGDFGPVQVPADAQPVGLRMPDGARAPIAVREPTRAETNQGLQRMALARDDLGTLRELEKESRGFKVEDARRAEFGRLSKLKDTELAGLFDSTVSANPNVPAMVDFDPKTRRFLVVSKVPGIPTQSLSRAEMIQAVMGTWEAGNGDYAAGVQALISAAQGQRALENSNFDRSRALATSNADAYFKGQHVDIDLKKLGVEQAKLGVMREEAQRKAQMERMGLVRQYRDPKTGEVREFYPVTTKEGVKWEEFQYPAGLRPMNPKADGGPPKEVPQEGAVMQSGDGQAWRADGRGGKLALDGVVPSQRTALLTKAGFDKATIEQLEWTPDGRHIAWGGLAYDVRSPQDMAQLKQELSRFASDSVMAGEVQSVGFRPRFTQSRLDSANEYVLRRQAESLPRPLGLQQR